MNQLNAKDFHILIVEDDNEIRDGIEIYLKNQAYQVHKAAEPLHITGEQLSERFVRGDALDGDLFKTVISWKK